jgi:site-specific DNA recombinase
MVEILHVSCPDDMSPVYINVPVRMQRRGVETKLIIDGPNATTRNVDMDLCRLIAQAHNWFEQLTSGEVSTVREIALREQVNEHEITRVLHLAFLAPKIVEDILDGRQAEGVSVYPLRRLSSIPFDWVEQVEMLENLG